MFTDASAHNGPRHPLTVARALLLACLSLLAAGTSARDLPDPLEAGWKGASVCEALHEDAEQRVLRCAFPPGVGHERHYHDRHFGYALSGGTMRITDADGTDVVEVPTGSDFHSDGVEWHEVLNVGDSTAVFLIVEPK